MIGSGFADAFEGSNTDIELLRDQALKAVKTFKTVKMAIWMCCDGWTQNGI